MPKASPAASAWACSRASVTPASDRHLRGRQVHIAEAVEPAEAEHQLTVQGDSAADQAGVAALGDDA